MVMWHFVVRARVDDINDGIVRRGDSTIPTEFGLNESVAKVQHADVELNHRAKLTGVEAAQKLRN